MFERCVPEEFTEHNQFPHVVTVLISLLLLHFSFKYMFNKCFPNYLTGLCCPDVVTLNNVASVRSQNSTSSVPPRDAH